MEDANMNILIEYIHNHGDKMKTYCIYKYIGHNVETRLLPDFKEFKEALSYAWGSDYLPYGGTKSKTTTWSKFVHKEKENKWKEIEHRYPDEIC